MTMAKLARIFSGMYVNNIAPVLDTLPAQKALFEDEVLNLSAFATDVVDQEELRYCWIHRLNRF